MDNVPNQHIAAMRSRKMRNIKGKTRHKSHLKKKLKITNFDNVKIKETHQNIIHEKASSLSLKIQIHCRNKEKPLDSNFYHHL